MQYQILTRLQQLYTSLDELESSGEDVVRDIKKEINNLELQYLKEIVFPHISQRLGYDLAPLRCQIDMSFQFNGAKTIDYSYCTSNSGMLFRDKYTTVNEATENAPIASQANDTREDKTIGPDNGAKNEVQPKLYLDEYSDKAIVVYGDTKPYAEKLKEHGGFFNFKLKVGPGWIFSKNKEAELRKLFNFSEAKQAFKPKIAEPEPRIDNVISMIKGVDYYINAFDHMRNVVVQKIVGPHKAILLLAIFEGIEQGFITSERIDFSGRLLSTHDRLWKQYVPANAPFVCNMCTPFIHLASEDFFKLDLKCEIPDINKSWTFNSVQAVCNYGILDRELFLLARDKNMRKRLAMHLVSKYCEPLRNIQTKATQQLEIAVPEADKTDVTIADFARYLASITKKGGSPYKQSTIDGYCMTLQSQYMTAKAKQYTPDGNVLHLTDEASILYLLNSVSMDFKYGKTSSPSVAALELYMQFVQENNRKAKSEQPQPETKQTEDTATIEQPSKEPESIQYIKTDKFCISEGSITEMFLQFILKVGPHRVRALQIFLEGRYPLIATQPAKKGYQKLQEGYWIHTINSARWKIAKIKEISKKLKLNLEIKYN